LRIECYSKKRYNNDRKVSDFSGVLSMKQFPFNPVDPGVRTLWVFQFNEESKRAGRPAFDFYIPTPDGREWFKADLRINSKAIETLTLIQKTCQDIKSQCTDRETLQTLDGYLRRAGDVFKNLEDLDTLTQDFKDFLRELPPPAEEEE
jgi:hypothetical protein